MPPVRAPATPATGRTETPVERRLRADDQSRSLLVGELIQRWKCEKEPRICPAKSRICWPDPSAAGRHLAISEKVIAQWAEMLQLYPGVYEKDLPPVPIMDRIKAEARAKDAAKREKAPIAQQPHQTPGQVQNFIFGGPPAMAGQPFSFPQPAPGPAAPISSPIASDDGTTCEDFCTWLADIQRRVGTQREALIGAGVSLDSAGFTLLDAHDMARKDAAKLVEELDIGLGYISAIANKQRLRSYLRRNRSASL